MADKVQVPPEAPGAASKSAGDKPYGQLAYAFTGDCRFNMGRSLLVMGALMGSDVRLAGPGEPHPPKDVADLAKDIAGRTGARITITEDPDEVSRSPASIVFDQAENRLHTIKAVLVATPSDSTDRPH